MPNERDQSEAPKTDPAAPVDPASASAPGQNDQPPADAAAPVDPATARAARRAEIEQELVDADRELQAVTARIADLRKERDELSRLGLGPVVSQAEALKRMVESDQAQRLRRAEIAATVTGIVGSGKMPTVRTPAEVAAMQKKRTVTLPPARKPE